MPRRGLALISNLPPLFTYAMARNLGLSARALRELHSGGLIQRVSRGTYRKVDPEAAQRTWEEVRERHLEVARHHAGRLGAYCLSHTTAALVHGIPLSVTDTSDIELTVVDSAPRTRRPDQILIHHSDSVQHSTEMREGLRVTTLDRTIADVLRTRSLPTGVAVLDEVLRSDLTSIERIRGVLDQQKRWTGRPKALGALEIADPRRETWLESYSFARLHLMGIPLPVPQVDVLDDEGCFVGRVDGLDPLTGTFLEADGLGKYLLEDDADCRAPEARARQTLVAEHARHTRLTSLGLTGARWMTHEIRDDAEAVATRVRRARAAGDPSRFVGWIRWEGETYRLPVDIPRPALDLERLRYRRNRRRT